MQRILLPFIAGFLAMLFFHEPTIALLHVAHFTALEAYSTTPAAPLGAPVFITTACWGGLWGIVLAWLLRVEPERRAPWIGALVFGGVALTAAALFVIGPLQGNWPSGNILSRVVLGFVTNAMWGWGALVFMRAFMRDSVGED